MIAYDLLYPLKDTFPDILILPDWNSVRINQIQTHTLKVQPGDLFVAIKGSSYDTHRDLAQIISQEPAALILESGCYNKELLRSFKGIVLDVSNSRLALAKVSHVFFNNPSKRLFCIGVTGTNGKTSVTCMIQHLLNSSNIPTARIGTLGHEFRGELLKSQNTTPGALELAHLFHKFEAEGARAVVMEVSSHALDQYRVDGIHFNSVVFLNLTHDHLDYHGSMQKYFEAKQRLFTDLIYQSDKKPLFCSVNIDDPYGTKIKIDSKAVTISFGQSPHSDIRFHLKKVNWDGSYFDVFVSGRKIEGFIPLVGAFNVSNFLAAFCALSGVGISIERAIQIMQTFSGVPGRLQRVLELNERVVFIDYAHTPDALKNTLKVLRSIRSQTEGDSNRSQIWVVFGCGGDRDRAKRPEMARIAEELADQIVVTSDNPRNEDPMQIMSEIKSGFNSKKNQVQMIANRAQAIREALIKMAKQDVLVIAGKGHENYQEIGSIRYPFSDYEEVVKLRGQL
jgi:UDP-N-acetylmuramoyl-L-alanyl-D-glutamate--2,6-diaminopimelate ligase